MTATSWLVEAEARKDEPLHPDLAKYVCDSEVFGQALCHPLVYDIPYHASLAWRDNDQYEHKQEALREARAAQDWHTVIWLHERPYRFPAFSEIRRSLADQEYWELLSQVWTDSENIWQNLGLAARLLRSQRPGRRFMMNPEERRGLAAMPGTLTIYRGLSEPRGTRQGWSWTLDEAKARWFSARMHRPGDIPVLLKGTVLKRDVIAYLTGRGEAEIIADPAKVCLT